MAGFYVFLLIFPFATTALRKNQAEEDFVKKSFSGFSFGQVVAKSRICVLSCTLLLVSSILKCHILVTQSAPRPNSDRHSSDLRYPEFMFPNLHRDIHIPQPAHRHLQLP